MQPSELLLPVFSSICTSVLSTVSLFRECAAGLGLRMAPFVPSVMDCLLAVLKGREAAAAVPGSDDTVRANEGKLTASTATSASAGGDPAEQGVGSLVEVCAQVMVDMATHCTRQAGDLLTQAGSGSGSGSSKRPRQGDGSPLSPSGTSECRFLVAWFTFSLPAMFFGWHCLTLFCSVALIPHLMHPFHACRSGWCMLA